MYPSTIGAYSTVAYGSGYECARTLYYSLRFKINKRESQAGIVIYYIGYVLYKLEYIMNSVVPLYINVKS